VSEKREKLKEIISHTHTHTNTHKHKHKHTIAAKPGMRVLVGEELLVVEAMKMRNILRAQYDGVVKSVKVQMNQSVSVDEILVGKKNSFLNFISNI